MVCIVQNTPLLNNSPSQIKAKFSNSNYNELNTSPLGIPYIGYPLLASVSYKIPQSYITPPLIKAIFGILITKY